MNRITVDDDTREIRHYNAGVIGRMTDQGPIINYYSSAGNDFGDMFIDVVYSMDMIRGIKANRQTIAAIRKITDGVGKYFLRPGHESVAVCGRIGNSSISIKEWEDLKPVFDALDDKQEMTIWPDKSRIKPTFFGIEYTEDESLDKGEILIIPYDNGN